VVTSRRFRNGETTTRSRNGETATHKQVAFGRNERPPSIGRVDLNAVYDTALFDQRLQAFMGHSDFANWGYWTRGTSAARDACENLMEILLAFLPEKRGRVLDVACGNGATTRHLLRYYRPQAIIGINTSDRQIRRASEIAPGCKFLVMDATRLKFEAGSFDAVICVEAAFHFETRRKFLQEVLRVLKPGGRIILTDILFTQAAHDLGLGVGGQNWVEGPEAYRCLLADIGFRSIRVIDATRECWWEFEKRLAQYLLEKSTSQEFDRPTLRLLQARQMARLRSVRFYVLGSACKAPG
jgi:MPBQ/MSBQ methyltransferase